MSAVPDDLTSPASPGASANTSCCIGVFFIPFEVKMFWSHQQRCPCEAVHRSCTPRMGEEMPGL